MSFSSTTKNDLCRVIPGDLCCIKSELSAFIYLCGTFRQTVYGAPVLRLNSENAAIIRKMYTFMKELGISDINISVRKNRTLRSHNLYILTIEHPKSLELLLEKTDLKYDESTGLCIRGESDGAGHFKMCCQRAFLRGTFLASGSISDPEKTYHLEITTRNSDTAKYVCDVMNNFDLNAKVIKRKSNYIVYLKEGERIIDFLNIIGAHNSLLNLENIRILKEVRNNVNRAVNCETANLEKIVNASVRQIENILYISEHYGFEHLPPNLREIAELRLQYRDASLRELGQMLDPPVGKSGVNHRLRKLDEFAEELRIRKESNING